jgi:hypothetical protein
VLLVVFVTGMLCFHNHFPCLGYVWELLWTWKTYWFVAAFSDYKQSLQFQNLNEEKQNIHLEVHLIWGTSHYKLLNSFSNDAPNNLIQVVRAGRRIKVSIYDLVVGDVVPLKIGDQVQSCLYILRQVAANSIEIEGVIWFLCRCLLMGSLSVVTPFP